MTGASFAIIGRHAVLFHEARQVLFELNDVAAFAWCRLSDGATVDSVIAASVDCGLPLRTARKQVETAVSDWVDQGLLVAVPRLQRCQRVQLGTFYGEISYDTDDLADIAEPEFRNLETRSPDAMDVAPDRRFEVVERSGAFLLQADGVEPVTGRRDELVPALRAALTADVLRSARYEIALHAACLTSGPNALLISGCPGMGKSTLAVALARAGLGYGGDDVALLHADGQVTGLPFSPALKRGSWSLLERFWPCIADAVIHSRPHDRQDVRYLPMVPTADAMARPVRWFVSLHRHEGAFPRLDRVDPIGTLRDLIGGASSRDERLTASAFRAIHAALASAQCFRLTYSDLDAAVDLLVGTCRS